MIINLNFNLGHWVNQLALEAPSEKEAITKLMGMTLAEIVEEGALIDSDLKITEIETSIVEYTAVVQVSNIEYDLDPEIMDVSVIEYLKNFLPKELTLTLSGITDTADLEDRIKDEIFLNTDYEAKSLEFQVLEMK
jgi:hypothetical protein